jgi:shikimate 5-dehydrogenase
MFHFSVVAKRLIPTFRAKKYITRFIYTYRPMKSLPLISPKQTRIGWIGTGVMGTSMCGHILNAGYNVTIYNRTASKTRPLIEKGAKLVNSPKFDIFRLSHKTLTDEEQT